MRPITAPQSEASTQVRLQIRSSLDISHKRLVHLLLVFYPLRIRLLLCRCLAVLEEVVLALAVLLLARPVLVLADARDDFLVQAGDVDDGGGRDDVAVVDATQWDAVGLEGTGDEEDALFELAQEHDALTAEAAREEDQDGSWGERLAVLGGVGCLARL